MMFPPFLGGFSPPSWRAQVYVDRVSSYSNYPQDTGTHYLWRLRASNFCQVTFWWIFVQKKWQVAKNWRFLLNSWWFPSSGFFKFPKTLGKVFPKNIFSGGRYFFWDFFLGGGHFFFFGPLVPWSSGPLVLRSSGPLVPRSSCPLVLWSPGPLV